MKWKAGMTRRAWLAAALGLALIVAGAVVWAGRSSGAADRLGGEPPALTVTCGGERVSGSVINYSWPTVIACGPHPLDCLDTAPALERGTEETVTLSFGVEPETVTVRGWSCREREDMYIPAEFTAALDERGQLALSDDPEGAIYCVSVRWDEEHNAEYIFVVR